MNYNENNNSISIQTIELNKEDNQEKPKQLKSKKIMLNEYIDNQNDEIKNNNKNESEKNKFKSSDNRKYRSKKVILENSEDLKLKSKKILINTESNISDDDNTTDNKNDFNDIKKECQLIIDNFFLDKNYNEQDIQHWTKEICNKIILMLNDKNMDFKYICNCNIFEKGSMMLHYSSKSIWSIHEDKFIKFFNLHNNIYSLICLYIIVP